MAAELLLNFVFLFVCFVNQHAHSKRIMIFQIICPYLKVLIAHYRWFLFIDICFSSEHAKYSCDIIRTEQQKKNSRWAQHCLEALKMSEMFHSISCFVNISLSKKISNKQKVSNCRWDYSKTETRHFSPSDHFQKTTLTKILKPK